MWFKIGFFIRVLEGFFLGSGIWVEYWVWRISIEKVEVYEDYMEYIVVYIFRKFYIRYYLKNISGNFF